MLLESFTGLPARGLLTLSYGIFLSEAGLFAMAKKCIFRSR